MRASTQDRTTFALLTASALVIALGVLIRAINHDESQYVAAIALMRGGLPYRDFAYLQTPLQPLLLSPLSIVPAGWLLIAARLVNGLFGFATICLLYFGMSRFASQRSRMIACATLLFTDAFLLASSLARNDALPMLLIAVAVVLLVRSTERPSAARLGLAGLALGLAASSKISAALPAAGAGLFLLIRFSNYGAARIARFAIGGAVGLIPAVALAAIAPGAFRFDVFAYNVAAPVQWWTFAGRADSLQFGWRLAKMVGFAALGSTLVALLATALDRRRSDERLLLELMIGGGLVAALLPVPFFTQYLVPLLPPLFARFAIALDAVAERWNRRLLALAAVGSIAGLIVSFGVRFSAFAPVRTAALASDVRALADGGAIVTLSPERIAGRGVRLDPRFAAGPFLFRAFGRLGMDAEASAHSVAIDRVGQSLDKRPPALILVGGEAQPWPDLPKGLDGPLSAWAVANHYRPVRLGGGYTAFVTPPARSARR